MRPRSPDLLDADDGAVRELARFLPLPRDIQHNHVTMPRRLGIDPDVSRSAVTVGHGEHDLGISGARPERIACVSHAPCCAVWERAASARRRAALLTPACPRHYGVYPSVTLECYGFRV